MQATQELDKAQEKKTPARFQTTDMADKGMWMADRICAKWPNSNKRYVLSWISSATAQNDFYFVHTKNAVVLAQHFKEGFSHTPTVKLWFAMLRDPKDVDQINDGADLIQSVARWASDIGADRIIDLNKFSEVPDAVIKTALGDVETEKAMSFKIPSKK